MSALATIQRYSPMFRLVSLQFVSLAAIGMVAPYINLYLVEADFSATLIGTLASVGAILALSITPLLNRLADKRLLHRRLYMVYLLGFAVANMIFASTSVHILLIIAVLLANVTMAPGMTLGMQMTMTQIATRSRVMLGQIRSFAALGFSAASLLAGQLFGVGGFSLLFLAGALFAIISIQLSTVFPAKPKLRSPESAQAPVARKRSFYVLLASQFFIMMGIHNSFAFLFIHLTQNLGVQTGDIGMWAALLAGLEIPFFILADRVLPRMKSRFTYICGAFGMVVFLGLLGTTHSLGLVVLLILFRGIIWPVLYLSSFQIVSEVSYIQNVATNQAIVQVTMPSIAVLLTGSAFGWVFDHLGSFAFFSLCALMCAIGASIITLSARFFEDSPEREITTIT